MSSTSIRHAVALAMSTMPILVTLGLAFAQPPAPGRAALADGGRESATVTDKVYRGDEAIPDLEEGDERNSIIDRGDPRITPNSTTTSPPPAPRREAQGQLPQRPEDLDRDAARVALLGNALQFTCSGALVSANAILTARHCLPLTRVVFGTSAASASLTRVVREARAHAMMDLALVRIDPVHDRLPFLYRRDSHPPSGIARLIGFGADDPAGRRGFGIRRSAVVELSGWGCDGARIGWSGCVPATEMVIVAPNGSDTCNGDSGGPVLEPSVDGARLVAVTSRALTGGGQPCGRGGIYERVDAAVGWMDVTLDSWMGSSR